MSENTITNINTAEFNIDLLKIARTLWSRRKVFFISLSVGLVVGLLSVIFSAEEYTVETTMIPQLNVRNASSIGLGSLAALAGMDISNPVNQGADISPIFYPRIVESVPFKLELINTPLSFEGYSKPISLYEYTLSKKESIYNVIVNTIMQYTIGLPSLILEIFDGSDESNKKAENYATDSKKQDLIILTEEENTVARALSGAINLEVEQKTGLLTLTVVMDDPLVAAQLAKKAQELLQKRIIDFKLQKAKAELAFVQKRYDEAKANAEGFQVDIAQNTDQYRGLTSAVPLVSTTRIQTRYNIANAIFLDLAKQLEQAKIQVKKDTPVFTIVQPVVVPIEKSGPNKKMIILIWIFFGGVVATGIVFSKPLIESLKQKWKESET